MNIVVLPSTLEAAGLVQGRWAFRVPFLELRAGPLGLGHHCTLLGLPK